MAMGDVKLLGVRTSTFVNRVQIALSLKSIDYEFLEENFWSKSEFSKSEILLKSNPVHKKIPVLFHNDKPICESLVIIEYIDELWASDPSILPSDPYDRAIARFWASYADDKLVSPILGLAITAKFEEEKMRAKNQILDALVLLEGAFNECRKGLDFFGGEKIGYLDLALGCYLSWLKAAEIFCDIKLWDETKTPDLVRWGERFCLDDAVKDVIPGTEEIVEAVMMVRKMDQAQSLNRNA